jgi:hypothetical protein
VIPDAAQKKVINSTTTPWAKLRTATGIPETLAGRSRAPSLGGHREYASGEVANAGGAFGAHDLGDRSEVCWQCHRADEQRTVCSDRS